MYPSSPQSPEVVLALSVSVTVGAPASDAIRTAVPSLRNPIRWPSGEKNGLAAPSVPAIGVASSWSSRRSQRRFPPSAGPLYTSARPSGESAIRAPPVGSGGCSAWFGRSARLNWVSEPGRAGPEPAPERRGRGDGERRAERRHEQPGRRRRRRAGRCGGAFRGRKRHGGGV